MTIRVLLFLSVSSIAFGACFPVGGDRIRGSDLASANSQFLSLPATLTVGFPPAPGAKRVFTVAELERLARTNGISLNNPEAICFELSMLELSEERVANSMRSSLPADAELKIIELEKLEVPAGVLEFPLSGLEPPAPAHPTVQLWRGHMNYAGALKVACWARVEIIARFSAVVANKDLPLNAPIAAASLRIETRTGPLQPAKTAARIEEVAGRIPRRVWKANTPIPLDLLIDPPEVRRGDPVRVEVQSGTAHLQFDAVAESPASEGEMVELRNPFSGKTFKARLDRGSKAIVIVASGQRL
jgi:flagella basal body P-ring formation protein FlgA